MQPVYWMHEQTGKMKQIITDFLDDVPLVEEDFAKLKWYIRQWIDGVYLSACCFWEPDKDYDETIKNLALRLRATCSQQALKEFVFNDCMAAGIAVLIIFSSAGSPGCNMAQLPLTRSQTPGSSCCMRMLIPFSIDYPQPLSIRLYQ